MVYKLICLLLISVSSLLAQQGNTVFAKVISANTSGDNSTVVPSKYMVGQPFHVATAIFSSRTGQTCSDVTNTTTLSIPGLSILASYDGAIYSDITNYTRVINPNSVAPASNTYRMMSSAAGAFPYIALQISNWNTVQCKVDVFYSGSISGLDIKKYTDYGTTSDTLAIVPVNITTATTTVVSNPIAQSRIVVYGWVLANQSTQNITFSDLRMNASVTTMTNFNNVGTTTLIAPNTNYPLLQTSPGGTLRITTTAAVTLSGFLLIRYE